MARDKLKKHGQSLNYLLSRRAPSCSLETALAGFLTTPDLPHSFSTARRMGMCWEGHCFNSRCHVLRCYKTTIMDSEQVQSVCCTFRTFPLCLACTVNHFFFMIVG